MQITIDVTAKEVQEMETYLEQRIALHELGMLNLLLEDIVLARVVAAGSDGEVE